MDYWTSLSLWLAALLAIVASRRWLGDPVSPVALIAASWCGTLGLYYLFLLPYVRLDARTIAVIAGAMAGLIVGTLAGAPLAGLTRLSRPGRHSLAPMGGSAWVALYCLLGLAGFVWYVWGIQHYLGWDAFSQGGAIRLAINQHRIPSHFLFLQFFCITGPLLAWAFFLTGERIRWWAALLALACVLATWATTDRTQFFVIVLAALFMGAYRSQGGVSWRRAAVGASIACALLIGNFLVVGMWTGKTARGIGISLALGGSDAQPSRGRIEGVLQQGATVYLYATGSYPALQMLLTEYRTPTWGVHTFFPVVRALQRLGLVSASVPNPVAEFRPVAHYPTRAALRFNGYTFLYYPLEDFGIPGAMIYALLVGLGSGYVYGLLRRQRSSPWRLLLAGHVATALTLTVFVNKFNNTAWWYIVGFGVLPFVVGYACSRDQRAGERVAVEATDGT